MTPNFAINGFGRIGRLAARVWYQFHTDSADLVCINTSGSMDLPGWAHLLKYDSAYGEFPGLVEYEEDKKAAEATYKDPYLGNLILGGKHKIPVLAQRRPELIPWTTYAAETIIESTGAFRTRDQASLHLQSGAKHVVISAPSRGAGVPTSVLGVNSDQVFSGKTRDIINNASCTTNCVAPVAAVIEASLGVEKAVMTTIHSYTDDQNLQDGSHKDMRRARAAAANIIPTSTGAAEATGQSIPALKGIFAGLALRVPTLTGSLTDFTFLTKKNTTAAEVNNFLTQAASSPRWSGILAVTHEPLVSSDIKGRRESSIVDLELTQVVAGNLVKIFSWYDNEWGYANRLVETAMKIH